MYRQTKRNISLLVVLVLVSFLWGGANRAKAVERVLNILTVQKAEFEHSMYKQFEAQTGIKINYVDVGWTSASDKLTIEFAGGMGSYDVVIMDTSWVADFAPYLIPLQKYFPEVKEGMVDAVVKSLTINGNLYAIPTMTDLLLLFWNTERFREAGLSDPPKTLTEMAIYAKKLTNREQNKYGYAATLKQGDVVLSFNFYMPYKGMGGEYIADPVNKRARFNNKIGAKALQYMVDLLNKYKVLPPGALSASYEIAEQLINGEVAMMYGWPGSISGRMVEAKVPPGLIRAAVAPGEVPGAPTSVCAQYGYAIPRTTKKRDMAIKFIKFIESKEVQRKRLMSTGYSPAWKSLYAEPELVQRFPILKVIKQQLPLLFPAPNFRGYMEADEPLQIAIHKALLLRESPEKALDEAAEKWNRVVAKYYPE